MLSLFSVEYASMILHYYAITYALNLVERNGMIQF